MLCCLLCKKLGERQEGTSALWNSHDKKQIWEEYKSYCLCCEKLTMPVVIASSCSQASLQSKWWDWLTSSFNEDKWRYTWVWQIKRRMNCEEVVAVHTFTALHWEVIKTHIITQWFRRKHFSSALLINHLLLLIFFFSILYNKVLIKPLSLLTVKRQSLLSTGME